MFVCDIRVDMDKPTDRVASSGGLSICHGHRTQISLLLSLKAINFNIISE